MVVCLVLVGQTVGNATKESQRLLQLTAADLVICVARVRHFNQHRIAFEKIVIPLSRFPGMRGDEELPASFAQFADRYGLVLGMARERVNIVRVGKMVATHLHVSEGTQVFKLDRIVATGDGEPIEWRVTFATV